MCRVVAFDWQDVRPLEGKRVSVWFRMDSGIPLLSAVEWDMCVGVGTGKLSQCATNDKRQNALGS